MWGLQGTYPSIYLGCKVEDSYNPSPLKFDNLLEYLTKVRATFIDLLHSLIYYIEYYYKGYR